MKTTKIIIQYLKKHPLILLFLLGIILLTSLIPLIPPFLLKDLIDNKISNGLIDSLWKCAIIYFASFLAIGIVNYLKEILLVLMSQGITKNIRKEMMRHLIRFPYLEFVKRDSGTIETYFTNDCELVDQLVTSGIISMIIDSFKIISIIVTIFITNYFFGFLTVGIALIVFLFIFLIKHLMFKAQMASRGLEGNVNNQMLVYLDNIKAIKGNRCYDFVIKDYQKKLQSHFKVNNSVNFYDSIFPPSMQIFRIMIIIGMILLSQKYQNLLGLSVGLVVGYIDLLTNLLKPIESLGMEIETIQKSLSSIKRIDEFLEIPNEEERKNYHVSGKEICLKKVSFGYEGELLYKDIDLIIHESLNVSGPSGSGKSTLFKLVSGTLIPNSGEVLLDGIPVSKMEQYGLFGILYQNPFFISGTVWENLTLFHEKTKEEVKDALARVGLERITDFDQKMDSSVLSSGEEVLFNLARLILIHPSIWMLDEVNSKIDPITMEKIENVLVLEMEGKMVISISHYGKILSEARNICCEVNENGISILK